MPYDVWMRSRADMHVHFYTANVVFQDYERTLVLVIRFNLVLTLLLEASLRFRQHCLHFCPDKPCTPTLHRQSLMYVGCAR